MVVDPGVLPVDVKFNVKKLLGVVVVLVVKLGALKPELEPPLTAVVAPTPPPAPPAPPAPPPTAAIAVLPVTAAKARLALWHPASGGVC